MVLNMVIAGLFGAIIPLVLKALRQDPALGSVVIVTTVTDVAAVLSVLGLAAWWLA
jgi:magnesium transporter